MIIFQNLGEIDIAAVSTFGVSVKEGDNPIGFFGTGLKYAIAVLLRTGHTVAIHSGLTCVDFGLRKAEVRGQEFEFVTMAIDGGKPVDIGFTTQLGKQWEMWMAYREIACNCKDEGGIAQFSNAAPVPTAGTTQIVVQGQDFEAVHADRHKYILEDAPSLSIDTMEVRFRSGYDFYYRGVRVLQFTRPLLYTYNDNQKLDLTEDRTVKHQFEVTHRIAKAVLKSTDVKFLRMVLTANEDVIEHDLDFHGWSVAPSTEFIQVVGELIADRVTRINSTALKVYADVTKRTIEPDEKVLTPVQRKCLNKALDFLANIGFKIRDTYPIKVCESLGAGTLGMAANETIYLAERAFNLGGTKQVASTLLEEYLHLKHGYKDCTRELQNYLFEYLMSMGEELTGEPL